MDSQEKKTIELCIRLTPKQKDRIRDKADRASMSISAYLLRMTLCKAPPLPQVELDRLRYRLDRDGRKLNNLMRWFNSYTVIEGGEEEEIRDSWNGIRKHLDDAFAWMDKPAGSVSPDPALKCPRGHKTENLHLRVGADQSRRIRAKALRSGMSVSRFVVTAALNRMPPLRRLSAEQTYIALMRIGNNMTQAKKYLDSHYGISGGEYLCFTEEFLAESARFRRAFGWDYRLELEEAEDGLC